MKKLENHPLADRTPPMSASDYESLKLSILARNGLSDPIVIYEGKILDGRHRERACPETGIEPRYVTFDLAWGDPLEWVISKLCRRNMSHTLKVAAAEEFMDDLMARRGISGPGRPTNDQRKIAPFDGKSSEIAGQRFGVSGRYVEQLRTIRRTSKVLYADLLADKINVNQAANRLKRHQREAELKKLARTPVKLASNADFEVRRGDCLELMEVIPSTSFRVMFADFPYNIGWKYDGDQTGDRLPDSEYILWCAAVIAEGRRLLTDDGSMFVLVDDAYSDFIGVELRRAGLHRQCIIVWWETFAAHNSAESGLTCRTRHVHYYTKRPSGFLFNTDVREPSARQAVYKDARANPEGMIPSNVWRISRKQGTARDRAPFDDAPPQLPVALPERCILLASLPGDAIFDPFTGNGITAIAACRNGRRFIGCEKSGKYAKQAEQWIAAQLAEASEARGGDVVHRR